jgi:hypothetical protein
MKEMKAVAVRAVSVVKKSTHISPSILVSNLHFYPNSPRKYKIKVNRICTEEIMEEAG